MNRPACLISPAIPACYVETFMNGLDSVSIDSVIDGGVEKFVDFYFMGRWFMIHSQADQWLLFCEEAGAEREFSVLQELIARKNTAIGGYVCILKGMLKPFFRKSVRAS